MGARRCHASRCPRRERDAVAMKTTDSAIGKPERGRRKQQLGAGGRVSGLLIGSLGITALDVDAGGPPSPAKKSKPCWKPKRIAITDNRPARPRGDRG